MPSQHIECQAHEPCRATCCVLTCCVLTIDFMGGRHPTSSTGGRCRCGIWATEAVSVIEFQLYRYAVEAVSVIEFQLYRYVVEALSDIA
jgi:hypothetical protein